MAVRMHYYLAVLLISALLSGCATTPTAGNVSTPSDPEREIFIQAITAGIALGAAAGGVLGNRLAGEGNRTAGTLLGAGIGSVIGGLIGRAVAEQQIQNLREVTLDNKHLEALLRTAQQRNQEVAQYNEWLAGEITNLKRQNKTLRGQIASTKLKESRQKREEVRRMVAQRSDLVNKLAASQRSQYQQTLMDLQRQEYKLDQSIKTLERMEEPVRVG